MRCAARSKRPPRAVVAVYRGNQAAARPWGISSVDVEAESNLGAGKIRRDDTSRARAHRPHQGTQTPLFVPAEGRKSLRRPRAPARRRAGCFSASRHNRLIPDPPSAHCHVYGRGGVFAPLLHCFPPSPTAHSSLSRVSDAPPRDSLHIRCRGPFLSNLTDGFFYLQVTKNNLPDDQNIS